MLETSRIYLSTGIFLAILTLLFHIIALESPRWKIYEHRRMPNATIFVGIRLRCENKVLNGVLNSSKIYLICDPNRYLSHDRNLSSLINTVQPADVQRFCNIAGNPYRCDFSTINKALIANTIVTICTLSLSIILIYLHLLINQFKYKTHVGIAIVTVSLLFITFTFILTTLIALSSTMADDLYEYRYNLNYRIVERKRQNLTTNDLEQRIRQTAASEYDIRLDWSSGFEIISLILSSFTLVSQILYLFSTYRNRIG